MRARGGRATWPRWVAAGNDAPGLATVLVGDDPASAVYVGGKQKATHEVGMLGFDHRLPARHAAGGRRGAAAGAERAIRACPASCSSSRRRRTSTAPGSPSLIDPAKDVDGLTPVSAGLLAKGRPGLRPCTPAGVMELLDRYDVALEGAEAVVVGRSDLVGKPLAAAAAGPRNATVTICHSRTRDLPEVCRRADVLVAAVGRPRMVQGDWVKQGATVIDVGINRTDDGARRRRRLRRRGRARAALITPVPRGVGPMTIAMLLRNTLEAARAEAVAAA